MAVDARQDRAVELDGGRFVFVGGMHRSGTTPLARALAAHPAISGMSGTGGPRDEGQHVQHVYPAANVFGGAGSFALRRGARLDEHDVAPGAGARLRSEWSPHWDLTRPLLLEKSPPNLIRTRYLQRLFPGAAFVVIVRDPVVVTLATRKWSRRSTGHLLRNWLAGHTVFASDAAALERVFIASYEHLMADPGTALAQLAQWLGLDVGDGDWVPRLASTNDRYLERWEALRERPVRGGVLRLLERRLGPQVARFGYDLRGSMPDMDAWQRLVPNAVVHGAQQVRT